MIPSETSKVQAVLSMHAQYRGMHMKILHVIACVYTLIDELKGNSLSLIYQNLI